MLQPPADVPAADLFRGLLRLPRPELPLARRLRAAPKVRLSVRALRGDEVRGSLADVAARALLADGVPAFNTGAQMGILPASEAGPLFDDVELALSRISPIFGTSFQDAWHERLLTGAADPSNQVAAWGLGSSFELVGKTIVDRPALYFGVPVAALIDAHWFAFRAARHHYLRHIAT